MKYLTDSKWWEAALVRAIKTFCQTAVAMVGTGALLEEVDWKVLLSASFLSMFLSILTSLAGLPEVDTVGDSSED